MKSIHEPLYRNRIRKKNTNTHIYRSTGTFIGYIFCSFFYFALVANSLSLFYARLCTQSNQFDKWSLLHFLKKQFPFFSIQRRCRRQIWMHFLCFCCWSSKYFLCHSQKLHACVDVTFFVQRDFLCMCVNSLLLIADGFVQFSLLRCEKFFDFPLVNFSNKFSSIACGYNITAVGICVSTKHTQIQRRKSNRWTKHIVQLMLAFEFYIICINFFFFFYFVFLFIVASPWLRISLLLYVCLKVLFTLLRIK